MAAWRDHGFGWRTLVLFLAMVACMVVLEGCHTVNINVTKNVGPGCSSQVSGNAARNLEAGGQVDPVLGEAGATLVRQLASALATDDDCTGVVAE